MIDDKTIILVVNRDSGSVGYKIPELGGLYRRFAPNEAKKVSMEELRKLSYLSGGRELLKNCLIIENEEAVEELLGKVEPEYYYTKTEIEKLLRTGSLDQLEDCLTFAPTGVIDLIKQVATKVKLNDMRKRELIFSKTGFNVDNAIRNNAYAEKVEADEKKDTTKVRKATSVVAETETSAPKRKTAAPKYKVTSVATV